MFKLTTAALAAAILCSTALPAIATEHAFTLHNNLTKPITKFKVKGGEVSGFKAIAPGERITFTVSLPDGTCIAKVSAFRQGSRTDGPVNICDKGGYILDLGESGPKFQPLSQVMLVR
jgi:hypothetical protein